KTVWKSRPLAARDVARLNDGTLMVAAGRRVVELTRSGGVAWEVLLPAGAGAVRPCLRLVRLGFDVPQAADLDLDASVEYRLAGLGSRNPLVRQWSARVLPHMGAKAEEVVPALIQALDDPDPETRDAARGGLEQVVGPKTVPLLLKAARGKSIRVRVAVALVCGQLAGQGKVVTPTLVKMLEDHDEAVDGDTTLRGLRVCHAAAIALGNHGPAAGEAVPALTAALKSDDALLRRLATFSLGRIELKGRRLPMIRPRLEPREDRFCPA